MDYKSPNFDERPAETNINMVVMHYTGMKSAEEALERMCDPMAKVSAHYMVDETGDVVNLVHDKKRAWHAGISCWRGISSLNDSSIGIEIVNPGHEWGYRKFPDTQIRSVIELTKSLVEKYDIEMRNIVGHSDIAPTRKEDPGELFPWKYMSERGVGLWPQVRVLFGANKTLATPGEESTYVAHVQKLLQDYGYHIKIDGFYGPKTEQIILAFKRHFVPEQLNNIWDKLSEERIRKLLAMLEEYQI